MHCALNPMNIYRIGTNWIFDVSTYKGYKVIREKDKGKKRGAVVDFEEQFSVDKERAENREDYGVTYLGDVPIGVIRKSNLIVTRHKEGELKSRKKKYC